MLEKMTEKDLVEWYESELLNKAKKAGITKTTDHGLQGLLRHDIWSAYDYGGVVKFVYIKSAPKTKKPQKEKGAKRIFNFATFGLFTNGFDKFDKAYEEGLIDKIFTTNLVFHQPELETKKWWCEVNMCKYVSLLIDTLNHDNSIGRLIDPADRIEKVLAKYNLK